MNTASTFSAISDKAHHAVESGLAVVDRTTGLVVDRAHLASDSTARYVRQQPVKALLIAAAAGALAVGLIALFSRPRD